MKFAGDPREITARFDSVCAESGLPIKKGEQIIYYPNGKRVFKIGVNNRAESDYRQFLADCALTCGTSMENW